MRFTSLRTDDRGSLPMALLVITVGLAMSATITPITVRQFEATRVIDGRNIALNAAQAGLDVMMARVRAASDEKLNGLLEDLPPCALSGDGGIGAKEELPYQVFIEYRDQDGKKMTDCPIVNVPTTAVVTAYGYGEKGNGKCAQPRPDGTLPTPNNRPCRVLTATYVFTTSNTNIPGGQIRIDSTSLSSTQCIDANTSSKTPAQGQRVAMKACNGGSTQRFGYTADLYLKLIYSESKAAPYGMCLDTLPAHSQGGTNYVAFDFCPEARTPRFQWSLDGSSRFHSTGSSSNIEGNCLSVAGPNTANSAVNLGNCTSANDRNIWRSGTGVGAGMAGDSTAQLVNYEQFSRCLDVTNQVVTSGYMIAWFCKQSPNGIVDWNQRWVHPVPSPPETFKKGPILVTTTSSQTPPNTTFCLRSPQNTASNAYVTVTNCTSTAARAADDVQWTVFHDTGIYASSYRIEDNAGFCLTPTSQNAVPKDAHSDGTSKIKVATCSSSELQKWNAPPNINKPTPLTDLTEK